MRSPDSLAAMGGLILSGGREGEGATSNWREGRREEREREREGIPRPIVQVGRIIHFYRAMRVEARPRSQWTTTQQLADSPRHDILWLWGTLTAGSLRTVSMHSMSWNAVECFPTVPVRRAAFPDIVLYCLFCDSASAVDGPGGVAFSLCPSACACVLAPKHPPTDLRSTSRFCCDVAGPPGSFRPFRCTL